MRFYISSFWTLLLNLGGIGLQAKYLCSPGMNCHGCSLAGAACPIGVFAFTSSVRTLPSFALGFMLTLGLLGGRIFCAFACPFGWLQEMLSRVTRWKIRIPRLWNGLKYLALLLMVVLIPLILGYDQAARFNLYFCKICPDGSLTASLPAYLSKAKDPFGGATNPYLFRFGILLLFLGLMLIVSRPFCRLLCPLGAFYGLLSKWALFRITPQSQLCVSCGKCHQVCPVDLLPEKEAGSRECIACMECIKTCPKKAIEWSFGNSSVRPLPQKGCEASQGKKIP